MRVGILVKEFPPDVIGGMEIQTMRMAEKLSRNHEVIVFTKKYKKSGNTLSKYTIVRIPNIRFNSFLSTLSFVLLSILYILKYKRKIDILQCMMIYPSGFIGFLVNKLVGVPYFSWIRGGDWYFGKKNFLKRILIRKVLKNSKYPVLVQSERIRKEVLLFCPTANVKVVGNGVNIPSNWQKGKYVYFVGNLIPRKGVEYLIKAFSGIDGKLVIVGDGPERDKLMNLCVKYSVNCEFKGKLPPDKIQHELKNAKILVLPAVEGEGLPNVILEAMALGIPVIATDLAGIPDIVKDGKNGFVVRPRDVKSLRDKILLLLDNEKLYKKLSINAKKTALRFSWENILNKLEEIYRECAE